MTSTPERKRRKRPARKSAGPGVSRSRIADDAERALGRKVALAIPLVGLLSAVVVGAMASFGSALLVLAASALLATIALLWASLRTLSGDAPLPSAFDALAAAGPLRREVDPLVERKRRVLRSLKDLEAEHALGKIDNADYAAFVARYRDEAKQIMREIDQQTAPDLDEAERMAREYLAERGLASKDGHLSPAPPTSPEPAEAVEATPPVRLTCEACGASNESDASFCKGCGARLNAGNPSPKASNAPA
jgi:hypothetical protein